MAKRSGNDHSDVMRQTRYPIPGSDLGFGTAIPYNEAEDVDAPAAYPWEASSACPSCGHVGRHFAGDPCRMHGGSQTFVVESRKSNLDMAPNPTRARGK